MEREELEKLQPEIARFTSEFKACFKSKVALGHLTTYMRGQLGSLPVKNPTRISLDLGVKPGVLQNFIRDRAWDEEAVRRTLCMLVRRKHDDDRAIATVNETIVKREGKSTAGVHEILDEDTGEKEHALCALHVGYSSAGFDTLVDGELYLPEGSWVTDPTTGKETWVPDLWEARPKWRIALALLDRTVGWGVNIPWFAGNEEYGEVGDFRTGLTEAGIQYVVEVSPTFLGWTHCRDLEDPLDLESEQAQTNQVRVGRREGPSRKIIDVWEEREETCTPVKVRESESGPFVWLADEILFFPNVDGLPRERLRMVFAKKIDGGGDWRFFLSNAPDSIPMENLVKVGFSRIPIEGRLERAKEKVGLSDFTARQYGAITRHLCLTNLSLYFLGENSSPLLEESDEAPSWTDEKPTAARPKSRRKKPVVLDEEPEDPDDIFFGEEAEVGSWSDERPELARPKAPNGSSPETLPSAALIRAKFQEQQGLIDGPKIDIIPTVLVTPDQPPLPFGTFIYQILPIHTFNQKVAVGIVALMVIVASWAAIMEGETDTAHERAAVERQRKQAAEMGGLAMIMYQRANPRYSRDRGLCAWMPRAQATYRTLRIHRPLVDILPRVTPADPEWEEHLRRATSRDEKVKTRAELALSRVGRRVIPYLTEIIEIGRHERDADPRILDATIRALYRIKDPTARTTLLQLAKRGPTKMRATALACLGQKPDAATVEIAFASLGADSKAVQAQARRILRRAGKRADDRLAGALEAWRDQDEEELEVMVRLVGNNWVDGVIPHLVEILGHPSPKVRRAAVRTLIRAQSAPARDRMLATDGIRECLKDESGDVRMQAVLSMRALGDENDLDALAELLRDSHSGAQDAARVTLAVLTGVDVGRSYYAWKRYLETGDAF